MRKKLISMFMLSLVSAVLLITLIAVGYYSLTRRSLMRQMEQDTRSVLDSVVFSVESELRENLESANVIANYDSMIGDFMKGSPNDRLALRDDVRFLLSMQMDLQKGLRYICVYAQNGSRMYINSSAMTDKERTAAFDVTSRIVSDNDLTANQSRIRLTPCYNSHGYVFYAIIAPVYQTTGNRYLGSLVLIYNGQNVRDLLPEKSRVKLRLTGNGELLADTGDGQGEERYVQSADLSAVQWTVNAYPSVREFDESLDTMRRLCIVVLIATGIAFSVLVFIQYRKIVGPVLQISRGAAEIGTDPDKMLGLVTGVSEYDELISAINGVLMAQRRMSGEMLRIRTGAYEERIAFLQSQINPHFLYNSLESIRGMAGRDRLEDVRKTISGVASIYRYCSKGGPFSTLSEEYACATNYMSVINLCYGSAYHLTFDMEQTLSEKPVPRMILQPLIENAVRHGFRLAHKDSGNVSVTAKTENGLLCLNVTDDGVGVPEEQLALWNSGRAYWNEMTGEKVGLTNVMRRVWLLYGENTRVHFAYGEGGKGVHITFLLDPDPQKSAQAALQSEKTE